MPGFQDWLLGTTYKPPAQLGLEGRAGLEQQFGQAGGLGFGAAEQQQRLAAQLGQIATGQQAGAGELAVQRQGQRAMAAQLAAARGARGPAAMSAGRQASRNIATMGTDIAGQAAITRMQEQERARALQAQILAALQQQQMGALGATAGLRGQDLQAELARQGLLAQQAQQPGALGGLLATGGALAGMAIGGPGGAAAGSQAGSALGGGLSYLA